MERLLNYAMDIGEKMLVCGAEVHRVEESIRLICRSFSAKRIDVFIITSSMVATIYTDDGKSYTQTRRITSIGTDYEKLHKLNELSRKICEKRIEIDDIDRELVSIDKTKTYPLWLEFIGYAVIAAAFTLFFGGGMIEAAVSLCVGAIVRFGMLISEKAVPNKIFSKFFSAAIATALAFLAVKIGLIENVDKIIIGNIMTLIPGIGLTNAIRDLFTGDSIAGLLRTIEAVLFALAIAAGYFLVAVLGGMIL